MGALRVIFIKNIIIILFFDVIYKIINLISFNITIGF